MMPTSTASTSTSTSDGKVVTSCAAAGAPEWRRPRRVSATYAQVTKLKDQDQEDQVATLVATMGMEAVDFYGSLPFTSDSEQKNRVKTLDLWHRVISYMSNTYSTADSRQR